jgi:hypothetical protein
MNIETKYQIITPAMARQWLEKSNTKNRPMKEETVMAFARDMKSGNWLRTHQGIAFDADGRLLDGQHRLAAIVRSGVTIEMLVTTGLPSTVEGKAITTMDAVDRGVPRSIADQLALSHGLKNPKLIVSTATIIAGLCHYSRLRKVTMVQILKVIELFQGGIDYALAARARSPFKPLCKSNVVGAIAFAWMADRAAVETFQEGLLTGANLQPTSPVLKLRNFLISDNVLQIPPGKSSDLALANLTLQALWLVKTNTVQDRLELKYDGAEYFRKLNVGLVDHVKALMALPELPVPENFRSKTGAHGVTRPTTQSKARRIKAVFDATPAAGHHHPPLPAPTARELAWQSLRGEINVPRDPESENY